MRNAVSKILTLTSTYDHRIIQGAQSGDFLARVHALLLGEDGFYDDIFKSLRVPYEPIRWAHDISASHETDLDKNVRVQQVIHAYRVRGHLMADTDPLEYKQRAHPDLDVLTHNLTLWDLDREFATGGFAGKPLMKLRDILGVLRDSYTRSVGIEYMHIQDPDQRKWIQDRVEVPHRKVDRDEQLRILHKLNEAEAFESFLQTKYVGQKRFSLEGSESLIPLLDQILTASAHKNVSEVAIGMPHRGRLNVLANVAGKSYAQIFQEFEGHYGEESVQGSGDVKYHLGTSGTFTAQDGATTKVYLAANPSHLEAVNPVLEGIVRAKQDQLPKDEMSSILPILMHGDASFAGQGIVQETLQMSQLQGYRTGGTIHIVVNNHVGFTTSPKYSRSSVYPTDVARMIQVPIFHVNGDDPEAVVRVAELAFEFRQTFGKDVVIDLVSSRRRGHNEADDPSLTQPKMYELIDAKRSTRKHYTEALIGRGDITLEEAENALKHFQEQLEGIFQATHQPAGEDFSHSSAEVVRDGQSTLEPQAPSWEVPTGITRHPHPARNAGRLHRAPPTRAAAATPRTDDPRRPDRLGHGRGACLRLAPARRSQCSPLGSGFTSWHLRSSPRGHRGQSDGLAVQATEAVLPRWVEVVGLRLTPERIRSSRLRIRLLRCATRRTRHVGGAVRRLRQWRADNHRRVHLRR